MQYFVTQPFATGTFDKRYADEIEPAIRRSADGVTRSPALQQLAAKPLKMLRVGDILANCEML